MICHHDMTAVAKCVKGSKFPMNPAPSTLDQIFDFSRNRQENPIRISRGSLQSFAVRLSNGTHTETLIVTERDGVLSFSMRWLSLNSLSQKLRSQILEYALASNREPYNVAFLAIDRGLTTLWACYRVVSSQDFRNNQTQYDYARTILSRYIGQPVKWQDILRSGQFFKDDIF